jgi:phosphoserine aminotransferase
VINFSAGPAALPLPALERAQRELLDFDGSGMSIMEQSHRGRVYEAVHEEALSLLRELLSIPADYHVLLLQGGASQQFAVVPMNLLPPGQSADYVLGGGWGEKAYEEAARVGTVRVAANTREGKVYRRVPKQADLQLDPHAAYVHVTTNNTLEGTQMHAVPDTGAVPLVADMSSDFLWKKIDVSRYGLIYAGAQKNIGPSGVVVVIVHKDLVARGRKDIPTIFRYETHAKNNSLYHTPPTFGIYMVRNVLAWLAHDVGGLDAMEARNREKASLLYAALDARPDFYRSPVEPDSRSTMNVVFRLPSEELEAAFVREAQQAGMVGLQGHRTTGGIRASIYNAVPVEAVRTLVDFMEQFARTHGG